jgi:hypothetical protein
MILLVVCHLITVGPMLAHSKEKLGDAAPFFWRWFDDENAMRQWTAEHQTHESLQAVPAGELPSYANYLEFHASDAVSERLSLGRPANDSGRAAMALAF